MKRIFSRSLLPVPLTALTVSVCLGATLSIGPIASSAPINALPTRDVLESQLGGPVIRSAHIGHTAFIAVGSRVHSLDMTVPENPVYLGSSAILPGAINDMVAADGIVFVAHHAGLSLLDGEQPARLPEMGYWPIIGGAGDVLWHDYYAYVSVTGTLSELDMVLDVAIPSDIRRVSDFGESGPKQDAAVSGRKLVAAFSSFIQVFDLGAPSHPVQVNSGYVGDSAMSVAIDHRRIIVGLSKDIMVLDADEPIALPAPTVAPDTESVASRVPRIGVNAQHQGGPLAVVSTDGPAESVVVQENLAYVAAGVTGGFRILDLTDLNSPLTLSVTPAGEAQHVDLIDGYALVSGGGDGLFIFDVRDPASPLRIPFEQLPAWSRTLDVAWRGERAMVAAGPSGLITLDVADPLRPKVLGRVAVPGGAARLAWLYDVVYTVAAEDSGPGWLNVVAVTNPAKPWVMATARTKGSAEGISATVDRVFVADGAKGLAEWKVSQLDAPRLTGTWGEGSWYASDVLADGKYVYVTDVNLGLRVIDPQEGGRRAEVGRLAYFTQFGVHGMALDGTSLTVAGSLERVMLPWSLNQQGVIKIDISSPRRPVLEEEVQMPTVPQAVALDRDRVYIASLASAIWVPHTDSQLVVASREDSVQPWAVKVPDDLNGVALQGSRALLAADRGGIVVVNLADNVQPSETPAGVVTRQPRPGITRPPSEVSATPPVPRRPTGTVAPRETSPSATALDPMPMSLYVPIVH